MADATSRYPALGGKATTSHNEPSVFNKQAHTPTREREPEKDEPLGRVPRPVRQPTGIAESTKDEVVYSPTREIELDGRPFTGDYEVTIRAGPTGPATCDIIFWNTNPTTWASIGEGTQIEVKLGWVGIDNQRVFRGVTLVKRNERRGGDRGYRIRGVATGGRLVKSSYSRSFDGLSPHRIVGMVADDLSINRGYISTASDPIDGQFALSKHKPLRVWLNKLATKAAAQTDRYWVWYIESNRLYFHPRREQVTEPVPLALGDSVIRASPTGQPDSRGDHAHELVMRCEPVIRRGVTVTVDGAQTVKVTRRLNIRSYTIESGTTNGRHHTTATAVPTVEKEEIYL